MFGCKSLNIFNKLKRRKLPIQHPARSAQKSCEKSGNGKSTSPSAKKRKTQINQFPFFQK